jgi:hypothetical protein
MSGTILMMSGDTPRRKPTAAGIRRAAEIGHHDAGAVEAVLHDTWGHLKAVPGRDYRGHVVFAHTTNREVVVLEWEFEDLCGGPWFPNQLMDFVSSKVPMNTEGFRMWRFEGTFRELRNGNGRFRGTVRPQRLVDRFPSKTRRDVPAGRSDARGARIARAGAAA